MNRVKNWLFLSFLLACLVSCTGTKSPVQPSRKDPAAVRAGDATGELQRLRTQLRSRLERREYLDALRLMRQEVNAGLAASSLAEEYGRALQGGMSYGQGLLDKGEYSKAGLYFRRLLELYPRNLSAAGTGVAPEQILQRLNACSDQLFARGLAEYRAGQLQQAIDSWTALLTFDPQRSEAKKAIETCTVQLRNLKPKPATPLTATTNDGR